MKFVSRRGDGGFAAWSSGYDPCFHCPLWIRSKGRPWRMLRKRKAWPREHEVKNIPCAPRNTTSFIMRSNRMGITAPLVSPATPLLLRTPAVSPVSWPQESLGDGEAKNDFKVDAYGSMKGRIRVRDMACDGDCTDLISATSQVGESGGEHHHLRKLARMDHGLQRFELVHTLKTPDHARSTRMEDQETQIAFLEEENLLLQQRLLQTQQQLLELRRRLSPPALTDTSHNESIGDGSCAF